MERLLTDYNAINAQTPRSDVASILNSIAIGQLSLESRRSIIELLLDDVDDAGADSRLTLEDCAQALLTVKTLCRQPEVSSLVVSEKNLGILFRCLNRPRPVSIEAQRCVANGLLLHESSRNAWISIGGASDAIEKGNPDPEQCFVAARILFLATVKPSSFLQEAVRGETKLPDIVAHSLNRMSDIREKRFAQEALIDLLKLNFNLLVHSKVADSSSDHDVWDTNFESVVPALMKLLCSLPPTTPSPLKPPLTYVLNNLIYIPSSGVHENVWLSSVDGDSPLVRLWNLLRKTLAYYVPDDPDDSSVRIKCQNENVVLDELVPPLAFVLGNVAKDSTEARKWLKNTLLPLDLDRSEPLEQRKDLLGQCIRLMASIHHPNLKEAVSQMIFEICGESASEMTHQIGYGNAAGFLMSRGITSVPGSSSHNGISINPITGMVSQPHPVDDNMTEEEKEAEAERLFVLFDRLERTGMGVNPVRQAQREGRLQ
ncbi:hypothetical protein DL93DRAFT_2172173 [Clavulina sp. PMI_390]|nr:hypothetical protein DL93DRAFT_2172173 [Clavulina sp. PMI_390]